MRTPKTSYTEPIGGDTVWGVGVSAYGCGGVWLVLRPARHTIRRRWDPLEQNESTEENIGEQNSFAATRRYPDPPDTPIRAVGFSGQLTDLAKLIQPAANRARR
jgi:hypothetical protein